MAFLRVIALFVAVGVHVLAVSLPSAAADAQLLFTEAVATDEILVSRSLLRAGEVLQRWGAQHASEAGLSALPVEPALLEVGSTLQSWGKPVLVQVEVQASGAPVAHDDTSLQSSLQKWGAQLPSRTEIPAVDGASFLQASASLERWGGKWRRPSGGISLLQMTPKGEKSEVVDEEDEDRDPGASLAELLAPTEAPSDEDGTRPFGRALRLPVSVLILPLRYIALLCVLAGMAVALLNQIATGCMLTPSLEGPQPVGAASPAFGGRARSSEKVCLSQVIQQCTDRGS